LVALTINERNEKNREEKNALTVESKEPDPSSELVSPRKDRLQIGKGNGRKKGGKLAKMNRGRGSGKGHSGGLLRREGTHKPVVRGKKIHRKKLKGNPSAKATMPESLYLQLE